MANSLIVRVRDQGGNLTITIPRQLGREMGWARRDYLRIERSGPTTLTLSSAEVRPRDTPDVSLAPD